MPSCFGSQRHSRCKFWTWLEFLQRVDIAPPSSTSFASVLRKHVITSDSCCCRKSAWTPSTDAVFPYIVVRVEGMVVSLKHAPDNVVVTMFPLNLGKSIFLSAVWHRVRVHVIALDMYGRSKVQKIRAKWQKTKSRSYPDSNRGYWKFRL